VIDPLVVILPGEPRAWARARMRIMKPRNGPPFPSYYVDEKTEAYKEALAWSAKAVLHGKPPFEGPISVKIVAAFGVPQSWSKKQRDAALAGITRPTGKPDLDNIMKIVGDALNKTAWIDDAQIVEAIVAKTYSESPYLRVEISQCAPPLMRTFHADAEV
jgi:Holliday junction resolvase RusA-like endonuclease